MSSHLVRTPTTAARSGAGPEPQAAEQDTHASPPTPEAASAASAPPAKPASSGPRDLRLDFFRGLGLLLIFIDHIPDNFLANFTLRSIAFSDAAEVFVFVSGYSAALAYGRIGKGGRRLSSTLRIYRRVWQLYVAHVFVFFVYMAAVSYSALAFPDHFSPDQFSLAEFLGAPDVAIVKMLLLQFQPAFLDILPLYILFLGTFPLVLYGIERSPLATLVVSAAIYLLAQVFGWQLHGFPGEREWFLNPFAWQFLFVIGATLGHPKASIGTLLPAKGWVAGLALGLTATGAIINLSWTGHNLNDDFPGLFWNTLGPLAGDKTNLNPLRLVNFLALAATVVLFVRRDNTILRRRAAGLIIACGQNSLEVFCLGILLSVLGHCALVIFGADWRMQLAVSGIGCVLMLALGQLLHWYKLDDRAPALAAAERRDG